MFYTIISKSGWQSDVNWKVRETANDKQKAEQYAERIRTSDARQDGYHVRIKAHVKPISQLTRWEDGGRVKFSDGTIAYRN